MKKDEYTASGIVRAVEPTSSGMMFALVANNDAVIFHVPKNTRLYYMLTNYSGKQVNVKAKILRNKLTATDIEEKTRG